MMSMKGQGMKLCEERTERSVGQGNEVACRIKMERMVMKREGEECK